MQAPSCSAHASLAPFLSSQEIAKGSTIYIAHVHDNGHFVLVTGWNSAADGVSPSTP